MPENQNMQKTSDNEAMLQEIVQNTEMGKNTLDQLVPMAEDEQFKAELLRQRNIYRQLNQEAHAAIDACGDLRILAESDAAGPFLMSTENGRQIFVTGHPEYDKYTLDAEYKRDVAKGLPIHVPVNYYPDDDPAKPPLFRWRAHAHLLYENWLNYYVYQNTPYDLGDIQRVKHEK